MKKIFILFLILLSSGISWYSWTLAQSTESNTETVCTQEWAPVCGQPPMNCPDDTFCAQVMPAPKTFGNKCMMYAADAEYLYHGECKDTTEVVEPICPVYDYASPPEGCWYEWYKDELGCKKAKLQCKTQCPIYSEPQEKEGCTIKWYTDDNGCKKYKQTCESTVCTQEYAPVCGYKESCDSSKGTGAKCDKKLKTFSNKCMMNSSGYTFLNAGECSTETVCPVYKMEEAPEGCWYEYEKNEKGCKKPVLKCKEKVVCKDYSTIKLMSEMDGCPLVWYTDENGCKNHKYVCSNQEQTTTISDREQKLKERIKESLEKLFKRMDQSDKTNEEKIEHFQKIIIKLMAISESRPKYEAIISYAIDLIENEIAELQEDEGMEDIFKLLE